MEKIKPQMKQVNENEVLLRDNTEWLHFTHPHRIFRTETLDDVLPALREIEQLVQENNWYAAGFLSYDAATAFDPALQTRALDEVSSLSSAPRNEFPYLWFGLYPEPRSIALPEPKGVKEILDWRPTTDCETYHSAIARIKDHIGDGRTYQVNFTMRLQAEFTGDAWEFFLHLAQSQNRHAAYIDTGRYVIASASPELFFQLDGDAITCRPMKGTTSRGRTTTEDLEQSEWLKTSIKNRAENGMIVDMLRNDLGRIAKTGSVTVPQLFETERYPTLWQMTSTITAQTHVSLAEIFTALFPSASITGAPKVSTMNIIAELENTPRKIYTGTVGYIAPQRKAKFNVAIRTAWIDREHNQAEYGVGGGIVWDSTSRDEYAEALLKARVLLEQPHPFFLLETMLWTVDGGFFLREKHVARMLDSAGYFGIPLTKEDLEAYLDQISSKFRVPQRIRILADQHGNLDFESRSFQPSQNNRPLKISLAREPIDSSNIFLFHKTTQRDVYESARRGFEDLDDVLLYNANGELTEFTIGNLVVELNGELLTPPLSCGVLAGTFRAHLLETGQIVERIILVQQLRNCTKIFRVNSIRRWEIAELISSVKDS
ncbi:MAG TPA: aminodeoxychorismate synthase component I [Anaerolineales bacterium]|nr:aminodeoxychorismate synthase component I [Anaerolineales bacterium]